EGPRRCVCVQESQGVFTMASPGNSICLPQCSDKSCQRGFIFSISAIFFPVCSRESGGNSLRPLGRGRFLGVPRLRAEDSSNGRHLSRAALGMTVASVGY